MTKQNVLSSNMAATQLSFGSPGIFCKPRIGGLHENRRELPEEKNLIFPVHQHACGRHDVTCKPPIVVSVQINLVVS